MPSDVDSAGQSACGTVPQLREQGAAAAAIVATRERTTASVRLAAAFIRQPTVHHAERFRAAQCTTGPERRITRWEHEHLLDAVQQHLDANPRAMRQRRETVEHPFGTIKARMGATHFLTKTLPKVAAEMALSVLASNRTRVMNIVGIKPMMAAIAA